MTHIKNHKLYNVRQRAPQKTAYFYPVAIQPFYLLLMFTLKNEIAVLIIKFSGKQIQIVWFLKI